MPDQQKIEMAQLEAGYEFAPACYSLAPETVAEYLDITGDSSGLYRQEKALPPMAVAARALAALISGVSFPAGSIHVSQQFQFLEKAGAEDSFTSHARISRKQERGNMRIMTIDITVTKQSGEEVLTGKTSFILPREQ